jgi:uncharacterized protein
MDLPISTSSSLGLILAAIFGLVFGVLLHKGQVTNYNAIVNLFRFKDMTVLKIMLTASVVGGCGVFAMSGAGWLHGYDIKDANLLSVILGGLLFGVGMVIYGYCPGTGVAAITTGSVHALVGFLGIVVGGVLYALSFAWVKENILSVAALGKVRLPDLFQIPELIILIALAVVALIVFRLIESQKKPA